MGGFFVFIIVMIVIWTISAVTTAANKQKDLERRRRLQAELQRVAMQRAGGVPARPQQISQGIAARFPDVLLPPTPPPMRRSAPPRAAPTGARRPAGKVRQPAQRRAAASPPPLVQSALVMATPDPAPPSTAVPKMVSPSARKGAGVDAAAITRWANPATLRQQFILTEIFQPPLALRQPK